MRTATKSSQIINQCYFCSKNIYGKYHNGNPDEENISCYNNTHHFHYYCLAGCFWDIVESSCPYCEMEGLKEVNKHATEHKATEKKATAKPLLSRKTTDVEITISLDSEEQSYTSQFCSSLLNSYIYFGAFVFTLCSAIMIHNNLILEA